MSSQTSVLAGTRNPFPGLRPYVIEEADWFFGREDQIQDLLGRLRQARFVAVVGSSGCGKSSLVRAGILPMLDRGFLVKDDASWHMAVLRPGNNPVAHLADALLAAHVCGGVVDSDIASQLMQATLRRGARGVVELFDKSHLPPGTKLLILVDQFEELFRFADPKSPGAKHLADEARIFVNLLLEAAQQTEQPIYVMLTMRSENLADCTAFLGLPEAINEGIYLVPRLTRDQMREAVEEPIRQAKGEIANSLVNELLNAIGDDPDQLPVLQHALMRLWTVRGAGAGQEPIDLEDYRKIGGLESALAEHLEILYRELSAEKQLAAQALFKELTQVRDDGQAVRRPRQFKRLTADTGIPSAEMKAVIDHFRREGCTFITPPAAVPLDDDTVVDISHESLIRLWPRLQKEWLSEELLSRRVRKVLEQESDRWKGKNRDENILLTGVRLEEAKEWSARYRVRLSPIEDEFLHASVAQQDRQAWSRIMGRVVQLIAVVLVIAVGVVGLALRGSMQADQTAEDLAKNLKTEKENLQVQSAKVRQLEDQRAQNLILDREKMRKLEKHAHNRAVQLALTKGQELLKDRDFSGAAVWFEDALNLDSQEENNAAAVKVDRLRLEVALAESPRLVRAWSHRDQSSPDAQITYAKFSRDGRKVLTVGGRIVKVWDLSSGASEKPSFILDQHTDTVVQAAFSNDGNRLVTASLDGTAKVVDLKTNKVLFTLPAHSGGVRHAEFSPDGSLIVTAGADKAVGGDDNSAKLWHADTGKPIQKKLKHDAVVSDAEFSPDGKLLVTASDDKTARVWNGTTGDELSYAGNTGAQTDGSDSRAATAESRANLADRKGDKLAGASGARISSASSGGKNVLQHKGVVRQAAFSPDGRMIVTSDGIEFLGSNSGSGGIVTVWSAETGQPIKSSDSHGGPVNWATFSPDGKLIVTASDDKTARIWSVERMRFRSTDSDKELTFKQELKRHGPVSRAEFSPDGRYVVTAADDEMVRVEHVDGGPPAAVLDHGSSVRAATFSPNGRYVLTAGDDGIARLWDVQTMLRTNKSRSIPRGMHCIAVDPTGRLLACTTTDGSCQIVNSLDYKPVLALTSNRSDIDHVQFSSDGNRVAMIEGTRIDSIADLRTGKVTRLSSGIIVANTAYYSNRALMAFSPEGSRLATGSGDKTARVWDAATGNPLSPPMLHDDLVVSIAFSPDGKRIATASASGAVNLWDASTGAPLQSFRRHTSDAARFGFSPDGRLFVVAGKGYLSEHPAAAISGGSRLLDLDAGEGVFQLTFSPDRVHVLTVGQTMTKIWDTRRTGIPTTLGHADRAAFSPDGLLVVTSGADQPVTIWDAATGDPVARLDTPGSSVTQAVFADDSRRLVIFNGDQATSWALAPPEQDPSARSSMVAIESGRKLSEKGGRVNLAALEPTDFTDEWKTARASPTDAPVAARSDIDWHWRQALDCQAEENWTAAQWHLMRLLGVAPSSSLYARLADVELAGGNFADAINHYKKAADTKVFKPVEPDIAVAISRVYLARARDAVWSMGTDNSKMADVLRDLDQSREELLSSHAANRAYIAAEAALAGGYLQFASRILNQTEADLNDAKHLDLVARSKERYAKLAADIPPADRLRRLSYSLEDLAEAYKNRGDALDKAGYKIDAHIAYLAGLETADGADASSGESPITSYQESQNLSTRVYLLGKLGDWSRTRDPAEAKTEYEKRLALSQRLVKLDPSDNRARVGLSDTYEDLINLAENSGDLTLAGDYCRKALGANQQWKTDSPQNYYAHREVAYSNLDFGKLMIKTGDVPSADRYFLRFADFLDAPHGGSDSPGADFLSRDLIDATENFARGVNDQNHRALATKYWEKAAARREARMVDSSDDQDNKGGLANAYEWLSDMELRIGATNRAVDYGNKCVALRKRLAEPSQTVARRIDVGNALYWLSVAQFRSGRIAAAKTSLAEYCQIRDDIHQASSRDSSPDDGFLYAMQRCGDLALAMGDAAAAKRCYLKVFAMRLASWMQNPKNDAAESDTRSALNFLELSEIAMGDVAEARRTLEKKQSITDELATGHPKNVAYQINRAYDRQGFGELDLISGDYAKATEQFLQGAEILEGFQRDKMLTNSDDADELTTLKRKAVLCSKAVAVLQDPVAATKQSPELATELLRFRAIAQTRKDDFKGANETVDQLLAAGKDDPANLYNVACECSLCAAAVKTAPTPDKLSADELAARAKFAGRAVDTLALAIQRGFKDIPHMLFDTDIDCIRQEAGYRKIIEQLNQSEPAPAASTATTAAR